MYMNDTLTTMSRGLVLGRKHRLRSLQTAGGTETASYTTLPSTLVALFHVVGEVARQARV